MNFLKSHFAYNIRQRNGIFFLLLLIVTLQTVFFFVDFSSERKELISENERIAFQKEIDSLRLVEIENAKPKIYPFNPNYISDFKGYQLGMSVEEIDKLIVFRSKNKFVNSSKQFQKVTGVSDSLLEKISPYFKFPSWVNSTKKYKSSTKTVERIIIKKDINKATIEDLKSVNGIGEKLANRIVSYRTKLQGYSFNSQLYEVWYLDKAVADKVLLYFQVTTPPTIKKININEASFKEVLSIVYLDYELTKKIFSYRDQVAEIQSINELKKIDGFPLEKFNRITLYLQAE
jgi:DNA uptake protein ComE-like DNA-binding protein